MDSSQLKLGENDIAEKLAASQRQISIAEFFEKNKHMLGFDSRSRALVTAIKEAVDNALDATEEAGYLPDIYVEIQESGKYYTVIVEDNGPGITEKQIPKVFAKLLYGSRFHRREQSRGQQGIGISSVVLYSQLTSGEPVEITSRTSSKSEAHYFELFINTEKNEPEIRTHKTKDWDRPHGTRISFTLEADMRSRVQLHEYIRYTAIANPHARVELVEPREHFKFERSTEEKPAVTESIRPHPHGIEVGYLIKMCGDSETEAMLKFLQEKFSSVGQKTAKEIIGKFRDMHYGREMKWKIPELKGIKNELELGLSSKGLSNLEIPTKTINRIKNRLEEKDQITYIEFEEVITESLNSVEDSPKDRLDGKSQKVVRNIIWNRFKETQILYLIGLINTVTDSRKEEELVRRVSSKIIRILQRKTSRGRITKNELEQCILEINNRNNGRVSGSIGEVSREKIVNGIWDELKIIEDPIPKISVLKKNKNAMSNLVTAMQLTDVRAPPTNCLSPIGIDNIESGMRKEVDAEFFSSNSREAIAYGGDPIVIEAGLAYGGNLEKESSIELVRFANRVPLVYQQGGCAITEVVRNIDWRNYGLDQSKGKGMPRGPMSLVVHIASTNVPFTSESKDAIARIPVMEVEIEKAIRDVSRKLKKYLQKRDAFQKQKLKQDALSQILPKIAERVAKITEREMPPVDLVLAKIIGNVTISRVRKNDKMELTITNYTGGNLELEITEITSRIPTETSEGLVVDIGEEWFIKWSPKIKKNESKMLSYSVEEDAKFDIDIKGIEKEKMVLDI